MRLSDFLKVEGIRTNLVVTDKTAALHELASIVAQSDPRIESETAYKAFAERERLATTGVGMGIAIPHGRTDISEFRVVMAISPKGVPFDAVDGGLAHILVGVLSPLHSPADQLRMLARISRVLKDPRVRQRLLDADSSEAVLAVVADEEKRPV